MAAEVLFSESFIRIEYDSENKWLYVDWIGFIGYECLVDGCEKILEALVKKSCTRILNDNTNVTGTWPEMSEWVKKNYLSHLVSSGCRQLAWVLSPNIENYYSALEHLQFTGLDIELVLFTDLPTAAAWLKERQGYS